MMKLYIFLFSLVIISFVQDSFAQTVITVNETQPCFMNFTAGFDMWRQCGADEDFLNFALLPFEWITGGFFSMILVSVIILMIYLKYHQAIYCIVIGIIFLPISFQYFPEVFLGWSMLLASMIVASVVIYVIKRQTE